MEQKHLGDIDIHIIRSTRRKTAALKIVSDHVEVRVPSWVDSAWVNEFIEANNDWIEKHLTYVKRNHSQFKLDVSQGAQWPYLGDNYSLNWSVSKAKQVVRQADTVHVGLSGRSKLPEAQQVSAQLKAWYQQEANSVLHEVLLYWSQKMGLKFSGLNVKGFKRRWGSCSSAGFIALNWRLVMAERPLIDYVVIHELAHLVHFNHGARFWQLVASYCPDWKARRHALNQRNIWLEWN